MLRLFHWQTHINKRGIRPESSGSDVCVNAWMNMCVCVFIRQRQKSKEKERDSWNYIGWKCAYVYIHTVCAWVCCLWAMEIGPYLIQQLLNDSIGRKQEQSLLYLCVCACVCCREADNSTVVSVLTGDDFSILQRVWYETQLFVSGWGSERVRGEGRRGYRGSVKGPDRIKGIRPRRVSPGRVGFSSGAQHRVCLNEEVNGR